MLLKLTKKATLQKKRPMSCTLTGKVLIIEQELVKQVIHWSHLAVGESGVDRLVDKDHGIVDIPAILGLSEGHVVIDSPWAVLCYKHTAGT
jgi:hypothetical protein